MGNLIPLDMAPLFFKIVFTLLKISFLSIIVGASDGKKYTNEIEEIMIRMSFVEIPEDNLTFLLDMIMILISCKHSEYFKEFKNEIVFPGSFIFE